jgi:hypothetical protein
MKAVTHSGRHDGKRFHAVPSGTAFLLALAALVALFILLFVSVEAR